MPTPLPLLPFPAPGPATTTTARRHRRRRPALLALLTAALLLPGAAPALADSHEEDSGSATDTTDTTPAAAGTDFRSAGVIGEDRTGSAVAVSGDYLYWTFPAGAGRQITAEVSVTLPDPALRGGAATWQVDLYDGLRRRQPCVGGEPAATADPSAATLELSCTLPVIRPWADSWENDPLPGAYYLRLTATELPEEELGLPFEAEAAVSSRAAGGSADIGGRLGAPLVLTSRAGSLDTGSTDESSGSEENNGAEDEQGEEAVPATVPEPEDGWFAGWWTDRWAWTAAGGLLAAAAAIAGFRLVRRRS
ncbi:hypothetical protein [Streptomyces aidingensis]|uniref:Peptidase n=1 Tax=Streptomyces aidingensis TaxID=910347 RepID=A0A1I1MN22_9ACTN|nr:hypothetical protein [Streptomyces aidingensis]SFC82950.1 hypothetical protein SAMN05421773_106190 [Streptomyces aidingensis]